jgi:hypothetical protein
MNIGYEEALPTVPTYEVLQIHRVLLFAGSPGG